MNVVLIILIIGLSIVLAKLFSKLEARQESKCELVRNGGTCPFDTIRCSKCEHYKSEVKENEKEI